MKRKQPELTRAWNGVPTLEQIEYTPVDGDTAALLAEIETYLLHAPVTPLRGNVKKYLARIGGDIESICAALGLSVRVQRVTTDEDPDMGTMHTFVDVSGHTLTQDALDAIAEHFQQQIDIFPAQYGWQRIELWV